MPSFLETSDLVWNGRGAFMHHDFFLGDSKMSMLGKGLMMQKVAVQQALKGHYSGFNSPYGIVYCPTNDTLYFSAGRGANAINPHTGAVIWSGTLDCGLESLGHVCHAPNVDRLFFASPDYQVLRILNPANNEYLGAYGPLVGSGANGVGYCPIDGNVYAATQGSGYFNVYNPSTGVRVSSGFAGVGALGFAYCPTDQKMYVAATFDNSVSVIDPITYTRTALTGLPSEYFSHIAHCPDNGLLFITSETSNNVHVLDTEMGMMIASIPIGATSYDIAYHAEKKLMYVTTFTTGMLKIINPVTFAYVGEISLSPPGTHLKGLAYCPTTQDMYVTCPGIGSIARAD